MLCRATSRLTPSRLTPFFCVFLSFSSYITCVRNLAISLVSYALACAFDLAPNTRVLRSVSYYCYHY